MKLVNSYLEYRTIKKEQKEKQAILLLLSVSFPVLRKTVDVVLQDKANKLFIKTM